MTPFPPGSSHSASAALPRAGTKATTPAAAHSGGGGEADHLIETLTRQRDLYRALDGLSTKQQTLIADGHPEQILGVLSERQAIVDQLGELSRELAPLRPRITEIAEAAPDAKRTTLRSLVDEVQTLLQTIIERDDADHQRLETSKNKVGQQLAKIQTAPRAIDAYRQNAGGYTKPTSSTPRFADARG